MEKKPTPRSNRIKVGDIAGSFCHGYVRIRIDGNGYQAHRLAWLYTFGSFPVNHTDHINGDKSDNRMDNLRNVTHNENMRNKPLQKGNQTGVNGVSWEPLSKKWHSRIGVNGKRVNLGYFSDFDDAVAIRKAAEIKHGYHPNHGRTQLTT